MSMKIHCFAHLAFCLMMFSLPLLRGILCREGNDVGDPDWESATPSEKCSIEVMFYLRISQLSRFVQFA